jgi:hypothetical protein
MQVNVSSLCRNVSDLLEIEHSPTISPQVPPYSLYLSFTSFVEPFGFISVFVWLGDIDSHTLATMHAVESILVLFLISLVSSAFVAPRDGRYFDQ